MKTPLLSTKRSSTVSGAKSVGEPDLEAGRRLVQDVGEHEASPGGETTTSRGGESDPGNRRPGEETAPADLGFGNWLRRSRRLGARRLTRLGWRLRLGLFRRVCHMDSESTSARRTLGPLAPTSVNTSPDSRPNRQRCQEAGGRGARVPSCRPPGTRNAPAWADWRMENRGTE